MEKIYLIPEGFPVYGVETSAYVKDGKLYYNSPTVPILVSGSADLENLNETIVPIGTVAYTADESNKWRLDATGQWKQFVKSASQE